HTLEELIWSHPRYHVQAPTFLKCDAALRDKVTAVGDTFPLALAGNHCQGTLFKDGAHLLTPALEARIDQIARHFPGFCFGRFDIRYSNPAAFAAGTDLGIVEFKGVTSESTNIYGPQMPLLQSYKFRAKTWQSAYRIGAANATCGAPVSPIGQVFRAVRAHSRAIKPSVSLSD
ncbi:MAG TPA: carboxylate--amine ligase, partial [Phycisphaerae bacterium]|nr:carboxylate--amine ligase [Phycisphaerae bacterium]